MTNKRLTRSSAAADGLRDAPCQSKPRQLLRTAVGLIPAPVCVLIVLEVSTEVAHSIIPIKL